MKQCGYLSVSEPFDGLFTQGMITHATYKDADGKWLYPTEVAVDDGKWTRLSDGTPVTQGRIEKMSKSKRNTVDPQDILNSYGADAARLFILSDSPPERDLEWNVSGLEGAWRYINRLYRLVTENLSPTQTLSENSTELVRKAHQTLDAVAKDIEAFHMNKAVARLRELSNAMESHKGQIPVEVVEFLLHGLNPMIPHITEELWAMTGHDTMLAETPWPKVDETYLVNDTVTMAVQVNGKLRASIIVPHDFDAKQTEDMAMANADVIRSLEGKTVKKVIVVPGRIVNIVAA